MPVQGLRSHLLHGIHLMDFAAASRAGDGFTASPPNQPWVHNDDKNRVCHRSPFVGKCLGKGVTIPLFRETAVASCTKSTQKPRKDVF